MSVAFATIDCEAMRRLLCSQAFGALSIFTTQKYFAGFDLATHAEYMKALTPFYGIKICMKSYNNSRLVENMSIKYYKLDQK